MSNFDSLVNDAQKAGKDIEAFLKMFFTTTQFNDYELDDDLDANERKAVKTMFSSKKDLRERTSQAFAIDPLCLEAFFVYYALTEDVFVNYRLRFPHTYQHSYQHNYSKNSWIFETISYLCSKLNNMYMDKNTIVKCRLTIIMSAVVLMMFVGCKPKVQVPQAVYDDEESANENVQSSDSVLQSSDSTLFTYQMAMEIIHPGNKCDEKFLADFFKDLGLPMQFAERYVSDADWGGDSPAISYCWGNGVKYEDYAPLHHHHLVRAVV